MTKEQAIKIFGSVSKMAIALRVTVSAVYMMDDELTNRQADRVVASLIRTGRWPVCTDDLSPLEFDLYNEWLWESD